MGSASILGGVEGGVAGSWGVGRSKGRGSPEGGARGVEIGTTQARGAGGGRLVLQRQRACGFIIRRSSAGEVRAKETEPGAEEGIWQSGADSSRRNLQPSLGTAARWAEARDSKAQSNQQSRPGAPCNRQLRPT